jgi:hypothetical protein
VPREAPNKETQILEIFYSHLTATRMEDVENIGNIDNFTPTYSTDWTIKHYM